MSPVGDRSVSVSHNDHQSVLMLGTFGLRPKATLRARALGIAHALESHSWRTFLGTTPWDHPTDAGRWWTEGSVTIANTRHVRPGLWPFAVSEMILWSRRQRPDVLHLFKPKGFGDLASRCLRRSIPVVVDMDDWEGNGGWNDSGLYSPWQRRLFDWQERTWPRQAAAITVASRELERRALELGAPADRVHYVPNGLSRARLAQLGPDPAASADLRASHAPHGPLLLLYTRFVEFDPATIADVIVAVRAHFPTTRLIVAGGSADGHAERVLTDRAATLGISDAIELLGWIDPTGLSEIAGACDVAIHPFADTVLNRSKCSVKLLELMATGIPVVTTRVGENQAFVEHGVSGVLVPPGEPQAIAVEVSKLLNDPGARERIGRRARARVEQEFAWERLIGRVLNAYTQAMDEWTKSSSDRLSSPGVQSSSGQG